MPKRKNKLVLTLFIASIILATCNAQVPPTTTISNPVAEKMDAPPSAVNPRATLPPTIAPLSTATPTVITSPTTPPTATPDTRLTPKYWREWEIVPSLSQSTIEILEEGFLLGNNPQSFSKIGDCQSEPDVFLGIYATDHWVLPEKYESANASISYFSDAFALENVTAKRGFGVSSVLSPLYSDAEVCQPAETPIDCELRLRQPLVVFVAMGTNWQPGSSESFERYLRQIVDILIEEGSLPVLVNKPDNIEGDGLLNRAIAQVAYDYDLPMINVWRALDYLPAHGLDADGVYMIPDAWNERSLYALVLLEDIRQIILSFE